MRQRFFNLQLFGDGDQGGSDNSQGTSAGNGNGGQTGSAGNNNGGSAGYSFAQAEEIANARAQRAEKAALASYFKQQGMSEAEINQAINDFKAKKAASTPDLSAVEKERDDALKKVAELENTSLLRDKGVRPEDLDYVLFKVSQKVDEKTPFKKAAEVFLKENPRFTGQSYRISTGTQSGGAQAAQNTNDSINAAIRLAAGK